MTGSDRTWGWATRIGAGGVGGVMEAKFDDVKGDENPDPWSLCCCGVCLKSLLFGSWLHQYQYHYY